MKIFAPVVTLFALFACATPAFAQSNEHSLPEDRRRFVAIMQKIERTPLSPSVHNDRAWAIAWLTDAPDISVTACLTPLGGLSQNDYSHAAEITVQYMLGMGAYIIEHPDKSNDPNAQQLAGVESALAAYRSIRLGQGEKSSTALEKLLAMKARDELPGFVRSAFKQCSTKGAGNLAR